MSESAQKHGGAGSAAMMLSPRGRAYFLHSVSPGADGEVELRLRRTDGIDRVDVVVGSADAPAAVLRGSRCSIRYSSTAASIPGVARDELAETFDGLLSTWDTWLERHPGESPNGLLRSLKYSKGSLEFTPTGVLDLLAPEVRLGGELVGGWILSAVYPSSQLSARVEDRLRLVLELVGAAGERLDVEVGGRDDSVQAYARTEHFDIAYLTRGAAPAPSVERVLSWLTLLLQLRDGADLEVAFPQATEPVASLERRLEGPVATRPQWLNLAVDAPCGQQCDFCSVLSVSPAWSGDDALRLHALVEDLASNAKAGVRCVRVNGYDPLAFGGILDLARAVTEHGYEEVVVFSPCTRLSDVAFLEALLEALPSTVGFRIPVYSTKPETHDGVVGRSGAHADVMRAIDNLKSHVPLERIWILSVAVKRNLHDLFDLAAWARTTAGRFVVQTPYPSSESPRDKFRDAAASFTEIAAATLAADGAHVRVHGVPPCVYFRRAAELGLRLADWFDPDDHLATTPGREYARPGISHRALTVQHGAFVAAGVDCPHQLDCALGSACSREVLKSYEDLHGLEELAAVSLGDLLRSNASA